MDISALFRKKRHDQSISTVDWIGDPSPIDIQTGAVSVDLFLGSRGTGLESKRVPVAFKKLADLRAPGQEFPKRRWLAPRLLSRGQHYVLSIAPHAAKSKTLAQVSQSVTDFCELIAARGIPLSGQSDIAKQAQVSCVVTIPDVFGLDPNFCVIPCMEVVRHFFCTSTDLAEQLLYGWDKLIVWDKTYLMPHLKEMTLTLSRPLNGLPTVVPALTQYAFSPHWRQSADSVRKRLQRVNSSAPIQPFSCAFPLIQHSNISVEAIALPANTKLGYRFFVTRIVSAPLEVAADTCWVHVEMNPQERRSTRHEFKEWSSEDSAFGKFWHQHPSVKPVMLLLD